MATTESFLISYTDLDPNRDFVVAPFTTNGPLNPTNSTLDVNATAARTSLILYGKGSPNYGDRIQENILHVMENFSGIKEPVFPVPGQMWFDRRTTPTFNWVGTAASPVLRVFDPLFHEIVAVNLGTNTISIAGNHSALPGGAGPTGRFVSGMVLRVFDNPVTSTIERLFNVASVTYSAGLDQTQISLSGTIDLTFVGRFLGEWVQVNTASVPLPPSGLDAGGNPIINVPSPTNPTDAANKQYVDGAFVDIIGDTMTGFLTLNADPTASLHAATKQYVDTQISSAGGTMFVKLSGSIMTGFLNLNADPVFPLQAATKNYVDTQISNHDSQHDDRFILLDGTNTPTTGFITLNADPTAAFHAATKSYVDSRFLNSLSDVNVTAQTAGDILVYDGVDWTAASTSVEAGVLFLSGGTLTGTLTLAADPVSNLQAATKQYVDNEITNALTAVPGDGVVNGGSFNPGTGTLTLTRSLALPDVQISGITTGGGISSSADDANITHSIVLDRDNQSSNVLTAFNGELPRATQISVRQALDDISKHLGVFSSPLGYDQHIGENSFKTASNTQLISTDFFYKVGYNRAMVFVDGLKQTPQPHNYARIVNTGPSVIGSGVTSGKIYPNTPVSFSGGTSGTVSFTVTFDAFATPVGTPQVITITRDSLYVPGATKTFQEIVDEINSQIGPAGTGKGTAIFAHGEIWITTRRTDVFGRVDILDIGAPGESLWAEINAVGGVTHTFPIVFADDVNDTITVQGDAAFLIGRGIQDPIDGDDLTVTGANWEGFPGAGNGTYIAGLGVLPWYDPSTNKTTIHVATGSIPSGGYDGVDDENNGAPETGGVLSVTPFPIGINTLFDSYRKLQPWVGGYIEGDGTNYVGDVTNEILFKGDNLPPAGCVIEVYVLDDPLRDFTT